MPITSPDARIKFKQVAQLGGPTAILTVEVFGGPIVRLQAAIFDANDKLITGIGTGGLGIPLTSEVDGTARWLFEPPANGSYMKWGIQAIRSAAGLGLYTVSSKVRGPDGEELAVGRFGAKIPDGDASDDVIFDGVNLIVGAGQGPAVPAGPHV